MAEQETVREVVMTFPGTVDWHVISRAVNAVYETKDDYDGYDSVVGDLKLEIFEGRLEVAWYSIVEK